MNVAFSVRARTQLFNIGTWIARDNEQRAALFVAELRIACEQIGERPTLYPFAPGSQTLRRRLYSPYIIFYRLRYGEVVIVSVRHAAQNNSRLR